MRLKCNVLLVFLLSASVAQCNYFGSNAAKNDKCFCKLKGSIGDCSCTFDTVDYFNNMKIYPRLQSLLVRDYFRFYKVNLKQECPFWADDSKCAILYCHVQPCLDEDIPVGLKGEIPHHIHMNESPADKYSADSQLSNCQQTARDHNAELGYLNTTISSENYKEFERWKQHDDAQDNFCMKEENQGEYVDLLLNPERYTGYKGPSAHRIWRSIYMENCFRPENSPHIFIQTSKMKGMCLEKRAFYRVISGLHSSINIHLCSKFLLSAQEGMNVVSPGGQWGPNLEELQRRFSPETTGNEGPSWLKNLYFLYLLELRALAKAAPYLHREEYYTGTEVEDEDTRLAVKDFLTVVEAFPGHFNESFMFSGGVQAQLLKEEFRQHFINISRIMDCVGCEKCKLWGKLQVHGIGTALKILFSGKFDKWEHTVTATNRKQFYLERSEIVALVNGFGRLSESIYELDRFRQMMR
ncbi:ero1-like protein [Belonocnema kinseyi]|uniref:ero1-like protein n=1 Tax=Belonocnema kinseyi TaxID=2817044 RepID=UPI00143D0639|nr:ero1-like protein [Belonocnema kinseyi]